jgi:hypothetical protein
MQQQTLAPVSAVSPFGSSNQLEALMFLSMLAFQCSKRSRQLLLLRIPTSSGQI